MRTRRKRNVVVLCALSVVGVGIMAKRFITPGRAKARSRVTNTQPADTGTRTMTVGLAPEGWRPVATVERDPFADRAGASQITPKPAAERAFAVSGIMRGRVSFATINGRRYREGESFDGVLLERVEADGVILVVEGRPVRVGIEQ